MSHEELTALCQECEIVIQEKVDGTNVGVFFDERYKPLCLKRAGLLGTREKEQYNTFRNWVHERMERLWDVLGEQYVLWGEWLWQTHAVEYDRLPDFFLAFDMFDRGSGDFISTRKLTATLGGIVAVVPEIWRGHIPHGVDVETFLHPFLRQSAFTKGSPEGVYIRFEKEDRIVARAKYRRPGFVPGWEGIPKRNRLASKSLRQ